MSLNFRTSSADAVVAATGLCHYFGAGEFRNQVLFDNTVAIDPGQLVIMTGPSGSGKTTLLTLIGALRAVEEGQLRVLGHDMTGLSQQSLTLVRREIGFIFQMHNLFDSLTAVENVQMATRVMGVEAGEGRRRSIELLKRLGLGHRIDYKPSALSGGQRQRVAVARALVNRPRLILADEPTAALDKVSGQEVVGLLKELTESGNSSVMMVTHDHRILDAADRVINMVDGRIVSDVLVKEAVMICEFLKSVDLFSSFSASELGSIAEKMRLRSFQSGEEIIRQGEDGHEFFLLRDGQVDVVIAKEGETRTVATLEPGASFGERALLTGDVRAATIRACGPGSIFVLDKPDFDAALKSSPDFKTQIQQLYFNR
ncbi:MAG: ATP-binding cassette domain-containing protein [Magnetococcus sp. WYHC-3]